MTENTKEKLIYRGRGSQVFIIFGRLLRMFIYQSDWKALPIGAVIAALVTLVVGDNMFVTQEGTINGTFALTCVCIWNGFFNSIQVVCRERDIIKKEHRAGMFISSYVISHMIYQLILCALQTVVTLSICHIAGVAIPEKGVITPYGMVDIGITLFLVTYAADIMALMVSCIVKNTTTAMTVMPFLLIYQLIFSGGMFELGDIDFIKVTTLSHWGMDTLCTIGRYNEQPMVTLWNTLVQFKDIAVYDQKPLLKVLQEVEKNNEVNDFISWSGNYNANPHYESIAMNVWPGWAVLVLMAIIFAVLAGLALNSIDKDKR